jgi:UPF0271 protein
MALYTMSPAATLSWPNYFVSGWDKLESRKSFSASRRGITVLREVFAERRYEYNKTDQRLYLIKRSQIQASITDLGEALKHAEEIIMHQRVNITHPNSRQAEWKPLSADTICIHSDSVIALDLALKLRRLIES